jgi:FAD/FMN-containing dehydrogenase
MSDDSLVRTGVLAQNTEHFQQLWSLRESIPEAVSKEGKAYKYDISVPVSTFEEVVLKTREQMKSKGLYKTPGGVKEVIGFGHIGDGTFLTQSHILYSKFTTGNLHLNVVAEKYSDAVEAALEPFVYELVGMCKCSL